MTLEKVINQRMYQGNQLKPLNEKKKTSKLVLAGAAAIGSVALISILYSGFKETIPEDYLNIREQTEESISPTERILEIDIFLSDKTKDCEKTKTHEIFMAFTEEEYIDGNIPLGPMTGMPFGGLFQGYTGIKAEYPLSAKIDWKRNLDNLWKNKIEKSNNKEVEDFYKQEIVPLLAKEWKTLNLEDYLNKLEHIISETRDNLDWTVASKKYNLDEEKLKILQEIAGSLDAKDLLSYSLTELMPSAGIKGLMMFELGLRYAGEELWRSVPAMGDKLLSYGMYQFTFFSIYDAEEVRGASKMNHALPEKYRIPKSVSQLKGDDHHRAAYLFMLNNMADGLNALAKNDCLEIFKEKWKEHKSELIEFFAGSHYTTTTARNELVKWVSRGMEISFLDSCLESSQKSKNSKTIAHYVKKTKENLAILTEDSYEVALNKPFLNKENPYFTVLGVDEQNNLLIEISESAIERYVNPANIIRGLDEFNSENGSRFEILASRLWSERSYERITDKEGKYVGDNIKPSQGPFYITVKPIINS